MIEKETIEVIESVLSPIGGIDWQEEAQTENSNQEFGRFFDFIGTIRRNEPRRRLVFEVRPNGEPKAIAAFIGSIQLANLGPRDYPVFVAPYIGKRGQEICKRSGIGCIDLSGNAFLKFDKVYIEINGKENRWKEKREQRKLITQKGTWIIRRLLTYPSKEWTLKGLALESGVSLGQTFKTIERLESEQLVRREGGKIFLSKPSELLNAWAEWYSLKANLITGYYTPLKGFNEMIERLRNLPPDTYALTMSGAAQILVPTVRSTELFAYETKGSENLKKALELTPVELGATVFIISPRDSDALFGLQSIEGVTLASNLQIFLDLFNYPKRGREQAEAIREQLLRI